MKRFYKLKGEAEEYSGESRSTLYVANKKGELVFTKLGGATRVEKSDLDAYLDRKAIKMLAGEKVNDSEAA